MCLTNHSLIYFSRKKLAINFDTIFLLIAISWLFLHIFFTYFGNIDTDLYYYSFFYERLTVDERQANKTYLILFYICTLFKTNLSSYTFNKFYWIWSLIFKGFFLTTASGRAISCKMYNTSLLFQMIRIPFNYHLIFWLCVFITYYIILYIWKKI